MTTADENSFPSPPKVQRSRLGAPVGGKFGELSDRMNGTVLLLYAISITWPIKFQLGPLFITFSRMMILALMVPMFLRLISGRYGGLKTADYAMILFGIWAYVAMSINHGPFAVFENSVMFYAETLGGYLIGRIFIRNAQDFYLFIKYLVISILISIPFITVEMFTGEPLLLDLLRTVNPAPGIFTLSPTIDYEPRLGLHRAQYTLVHPILFGMFCSSLVALTFVVMTRGDSAGAKTFWGFVVAFGTFAALSSAGWLAALLQIAILFYERFTRFIMAFRWKLIFWGFVAFYIFVEIFASHSPLVVLATKLTLSPHNAWTRILIWEYGSLEVWRHPIFGIGMNDWVRPGYMPPSVDNYWLLTGMRYGLPGVFLIVLATLAPLFAVGRADTSKNDVLKSFQLGYMCCMFGWIFAMTTCWINVEIHSLYLTMLASGYWIADQARQETGGTSQDSRDRGGRRGKAGRAASRREAQAPPDAEPAKTQERGKRQARTPRNSLRERRERRTSR